MDQFREVMMAAQMALSEVERACVNNIQLIQECQGALIDIEQAFLTQEEEGLAEATVNLLENTGYVDIHTSNNRSTADGNAVLCFYDRQEALQIIAPELPKLLRKLAELGHDVDKFEKEENTEDKDELEASLARLAVGDESQVMRSLDLSNASSSTSNEVGCGSVGQHKFYAVMVGRNPGVFEGSHAIQANIAGISGALVEEFETDLSARTAYIEALRGGRVIRVTLTILTEDSSQSDDVQEMLACGQTT